MEGVVSPVYRVEGLSFAYGAECRSRGERRTVLKNVSLTVSEGEVLGIVGGSGSGKTTLVSLMSGVIPPPEGTVFFRGRDLARLSQRERREAERQVQMVFQDPKSSFNPRHTVGRSMWAALRASGVRDGDVQGERIGRALRDLRLDLSLLKKLPSQLSGGQIQRCAVARALSLEPRVLILDEPVSALDVSVQAGVMNTLKDILKKHHLSALLVAHDLAVVGYMADRVCVLREGEIVERGGAREVFSSPRHPYTKELVGAIPVIGRGKGEE